MSTDQFSLNEINRTCYKSKLVLKDGKEKIAHRTNCPGCQNQEAPILRPAPLFGQFWGDRPFAVFECGFCGAGWSSGLFSKEEVAKHENSNA